MKPSRDTDHHWAAARIASGNAFTCLHFGMYAEAARYADKASEARSKIVWERHEDTDESGFDV